MPSSVAGLSKVSVCCRLLAEIVGSNPAEGMDMCLFFTVVCFQLEVSATGRSLVLTSLTDCAVSN
jgi:hypothetical protein